MHNNHIFIGVDGGGTKCFVRIEDARTNLLAKAQGGPANISYSVAGAWQSIFTTIEKAIQQIKLDLNDKNYQFHVGMGLAGTENPQDVNAFLAHPHPFTSLKLAPDSVTACLGAHGGKDGAIIIIGTGTIGCKIIADSIIHVGGLVFPIDDEGSGAWLGLEALRLTCKAYDDRIEPSMLTKDILAKFNNDITKLISFTMAANANSYATLAPIVIKNLHNKDPYAIKLMQQGAKHIELIMNTLEKTKPIKCILYSLVGGLAPFMQPLLSQDLQQKLVPKQADATKGAILLLQNSCYAFC